MIELTRLNNEKFRLNAILVEQIQSLPDTTITLLNGKKLVVKDKEKDVIQLIEAFYQTLGLQQVIVKAGEDDEQ